MVSDFSAACKGVFGLLGDLITVTGQVATLFLMMAVGFYMAKRGILSEETQGQLSVLLLYVASPCVMLECLWLEHTPAMAREVCLGMVVAGVCYLVYLLVPLPFFRRQRADIRDSLRFGVAFGNIGFMGLPLVQSVLGQEAVVYGALTMGIFNATSWTFGVAIMGGRQAASPRKAVLNPGVLSLAGGLLLFFTGLRLPAPAANAVCFLADLNTPLAMVVIGAQLASADLPAAFRSPLLYGGAVLKLLVLPLLTILLLLPLPVSPGLFCALVLLGGTPTAGITAIFAQRYGRDYVPAAQLVTLTTLLSILTLPVMAVLARTLSGF